MGVAIGVGQVAANLSTGTQDITDANLGVTAKFALPFGTRGLVNGTPADGAGMYWGIADGALQASWAAEEEHNLDTSDSHLDSDNNSILRIMDGAADANVDAEADHSSFISNGERINWVDAPSAAFLLNALLGGGTDLSVKIVSQALGTGTSGLDVTGVGFESDDVIVLFYGDTNNPQVGMGLVHNDRAGTVTQRYLGGRTRTARGTSENQSVTYDDACLALMGNTAVTTKLVMSDFDGDGFTVTPSASFSNATAVFLCLRYGSSPVIASKVYTFDTPTGIGEATDGGPNFTPQAILYIMGLNEAVNTYDTGSQSYSVGFAVVTPNAQYCSVFTSEDGSGTSDTQSLTDDQAFNHPLHDGSDGLVATYVSTQSTGFRYDWTAVAGSAKKYIALAWESEGGGTTYNQSVDGTLTSSGALVNSALKVVAGTLATAGTLVNSARKVLAGTLSASGVVEAVKTALISLGGTLSMSGEVVRRAGKTLAGSLTSSGALINSACKVLAGTLSTSGVVGAVKTALISLGGTLSMSGEVVRRAGKTLAGSLTSSGEISKAVRKVLAGTLSASGVVEAVKTALISLGGTLSMSGEVVRRAGKTLAGSLTSSGEISKAVRKVLAGTLTTAGTLAKRMYVVLAGILGLAGDVDATTEIPAPITKVQPDVRYEARRGSQFDRWRH